MRVPACGGAMLKLLRVARVKEKPRHRYRELRQLATPVKMDSLITIEKARFPKKATKRGRSAVPKSFPEFIGRSFCFPGRF
jgi:hypothetical protein